MKKTFRKFCETTSLHGWNRIPVGSRFDKIYWLLVILASLTLGGVLIVQTLQEFSRSTVDTRVTTTTAPLSMTTFPKLSICNAFKIRNSFLNEAFSNIDDFWGRLRMMYTFVREFLQGYSEEMKEALGITEFYKNLNNETFLNVLKTECPYTGNRSQEMSFYPIKGPFNPCKLQAENLPFNFFDNKMPVFATMGQSIFDMVLKLQLQNLIYFEPLTTEHESLSFADANSLCYSILPLKKEFPVISGKKNGIKILLDAETYDVGYNENEDAGFNIVLSDPHDIPNMNLNGIAVSPGKKVNIKIRPEIYKITDDAMKRFSPKGRRCIGKKEFKQFMQFGFFKEYSLTKCLMFATEVETMKECGIFRHGYQSGVALGCVNSVWNKYGSKDTVRNGDGEDLKCLDACARQENAIFVSENAYPTYNFLYSNIKQPSTIRKRAIFPP